MKKHPLSIGSRRKLADALGVDEKTVRNLVGRPDWPAAKGPPWSAGDVEAVGAWRQTLQEDRSRESGIATQAKALLAVESAKMKQLQRKKLEGLVIDRGLLDSALLALTKLFVGSLEELERALPLQIAGLDPGQVERVVKDRVRSIRDQLASRQVLELESIEQAVRSQALPKARGRPGARR